MPAQADNKLQVINARQDGDKLTFYVLFTDAISEEAIDYIPNTLDIYARMSTKDDSQTLSVQRFSDVDEGVTYAVLLDMNYFALNDVNLKEYQNTVQRLIMALHDNDCMRIYTVGKSGLTLLTNGFEYNHLNLCDIIINKLNTSGQATSTGLYQSISKTIETISSFVYDLQRRKIVLVFTYGADNKSFSLDDLVDQASKSKIPVSFITLTGRNEDYSICKTDTTGLNSIARASRGWILSGVDPKSAVDKFISYIDNTLVLTVQPSDMAWDLLSTTWNVFIRYQGNTISNGPEGDYYINIEATPSPTPTQTATIGPTPTLTVSKNVSTLLTTEFSQSVSRSVNILWNDNNDELGLRPDHVYVRLYANGEYIENPLILTAEKNWNDSWQSLQSGLVYSVDIQNVTNYTFDYGNAKDSIVFNVTGTVKDKNPDNTLTAAVVWDDFENSDKVRPESLTVSLKKDGKATGQKIDVSAASSWRGTFYYIDENVHYDIEPIDIEGYTFKSELYQPNNICVIVATHDAIPPNVKRICTLMYIFLFSSILLVIFTIFLLYKQNKMSAYISEFSSQTIQNSDSPNHKLSSDPVTSERNKEETREESDTSENEIENHYRGSNVSIQMYIQTERGTLQQKYILDRWLFIGRSTSCNLVLEDMQVSPKHCQLTLKNNAVYIKSIGNSLTLLNGHVINAEEIVHDDDIVTIGKTTIIFGIIKI